MNRLSRKSYRSSSCKYLQRQLPLQVLAGALFSAALCQAQPVARVKPYRVSASLREVKNLKSVSKIAPLSGAQKTLLSKNLFAVAPTNASQLFFVYEENDYLNLPSLVTTDSVLQLYHIFYDFSLRTVETQKLSPVLGRLDRGMLNASIADWNAAKSSELKAAALKNVAYFAVADRLLGGNSGVPDEAKALIAAELGRINGAQGFAQSAIFPYKVDYSQFIVRGHYTRSEALKKYFRAMMWHGLVPFALRTNGQRNDEQIRQGLLWVRALYRTNLAKEWARVYEPTTFFVGTSDDMTPRHWKVVSDAIYGASPMTNDFADNTKLTAFVSRLERSMKAPRIAAKFASQMSKLPPNAVGFIDGPLPSTAQLRFMGQRYVPDSEILQKLSTPVARVFPSGLDVMAVLGSARAQSHLDNYAQLYDTRRWPLYRSKRAQLTEQFAKLPQATWNSNLYYGWLYALKALLTPAPTGYPSFMRNAAWDDKSLHTGLASWSQLRHDTILYAKQSVVEMGGAEDPKPFVKGYVEPNIAFYDRLLKLTTLSRQGLSKRELLSEELGEKFKEFEATLTQLRRVSAKELQNQKLTEQEYLDIRYIGGTLEYMTLGVMGDGPTSWSLMSQTDRDMATVADVHTGFNAALEEGVGRTMEMWAVVPIEGQLSLARGPVFSYYEWKQPISARLTDEKWQAMIRSGKTPPRPPWTSSFIAPGPTRNIKYTAE